MEQNRITIETQKKGRPIGDLFGIFFEDLNHAADGGLYAEMVQNRSFEFAEIDNPSYHSLTAWEKVEAEGKAEIAVLEGDAVSAGNPHYLHMDILEPGADVGIRNLGFGKGMCFQRGKKYLFSCYARSAGSAECTIRVTLRNEEDACLAEDKWTVRGQWEKHTAVLEIADGGGASGAAGSGISKGTAGTEDPGISGGIEETGESRIAGGTKGTGESGETGQAAEAYG